MLYMRIRKDVLVITVQNSPQHLPVYLVLAVHVRVLLVYSKELNHVKAGL